MGATHLQTVDPKRLERHIAHILIAQVSSDDDASNRLQHIGYSLLDARQAVEIAHAVEPGQQCSDTADNSGACAVEDMGTLWQ